MNDNASDPPPIFVELMYPRLPQNPKTVRVQLFDVRAADDLIITYDFDRDGWRIGMDRVVEVDSSYLDVLEENEEVAFIPAWNEETRPEATRPERGWRNE